ncbi:MAG: hypothetical protein WCL44_06565, partial [bacterium]
PFSILTRGLKNGVHYKVNVYEFDYSAEDLKILKRYKSSESKYKIAIAVPAGFDPSKPQRVFVCSAAGNNEAEIKAGDVAVMGLYAQHCVDNGWVCLATDNDLGNAGDYEQAMISALQTLARAWPNMSSWEFAVGGFSGGAKGCFSPCSVLVGRKHKVIGVFLAGCNEDWSARFRKDYHAKDAGFRHIRAFLSVGDKDDIATVAHCTNVKNSLKANGIRDSRLEVFAGGHAMNGQHFVQALKWFAEDRPKSASAKLGGRQPSPAEPEQE